MQWRTCILKLWFPATTDEAFVAWLARYELAERKTAEAYERCIAYRMQRRVDVMKLFFGLCEATEDVADIWRRMGCWRTKKTLCFMLEDILYVWMQRQDSYVTAIRFGSMVHALECYLDNSLLRDVLIFKSKNWKVHLHESLKKRMCPDRVLRFLRVA